MGERDLLNHAKTRRLWIPHNSFMSFLNDGTNMESQAGSGTAIQAVTAGASELVATLMSSNDELHTLIPIPWDMDRTKKVLGRVWYIHSSTDADADIDWQVGTLFFEKQAAAAEIQGGADVTTNITNHTCSTTGESLEITPWTDLSWDDYITDDDAAAGLAVELQDDGAASADECEFLGLELLYEPDAHYLDGVPDSDSDLADNVL